MAKIKSGTVQENHLLEFATAFPNEKPLRPEEYLKGGSREVILTVATLFLGFKSHNSEFENNENLLRSLFCEENRDFATKIYREIIILERSGKKVGIINPHCSLILFELFFSMPDAEITQSNSEFERNLFKAYLVIIGQMLKSQERAFTSTADLQNPLKISMMFFCMHYPIADKMNFDIKEIWACQCFKAIYLFKFLESNPTTQNLLIKFLDYFERPNWKEYLKSIIASTTSVIKNEHEGYINLGITDGENFENYSTFLDKLIVQENDTLDEHDFLTLRASPFYKLPDGNYRVVFNLFVVEKIFKGIYFQMRDLNKELPEEQKVKSLKGIFGHEFSEQTLLYQIMETIYPNQTIRYTGKELDEIVGPGAPDYYLRTGKRVLIFESKDFLIRKDLKLSFDFDIYDKEFSKTLYFEIKENGKEKAGAVLQLVGNIRKLLSKEFPADTEYHYKDIYIYPILITHDHQYDVPGLSDLLNDWFQEELAILESEGLYTKHVKPIVIVNIDSLIYNQIGLSEKITLHEVLDAYLTHIKTYPAAKSKSIEEEKRRYYEKAVPFATFIHNYFSQKGIKTPPPLMDFVVPELFN